MTTRSSAAPYLYGSVAGLAAALALFAILAGMLALASLSIGTSTTGYAAAELTVTASLLGLVAFLSGAFGGLAISAVTYAIGRAQDPDTPRFSFPVVAPIGVLLPAALSFAVMSLGATLFGSSTDGIVTVPVAPFIVIAALAGLIAGAVTVPIVTALSRRSSMGDTNEATPTSGGAFWSDVARSVGVPALAIGVGALIAIGLAEILLSTGSTVVAVAIFAGAGAVILAATALFALRPWDKK